MSYNYQECVIDERDFKYPTNEIANDKEKHDIRESCFVPAILDQMDMGICTSIQAINALLFVLKKTKKPHFLGSALYNYYYGRISEGSNTDEDTGISIKTAIKALIYDGICPESEHMCIDENLKVEPSRSAKLYARRNRQNLVYYSVNQKLEDIKSVLLSNYSILLGINIYSSIEGEIARATGIVEMPSKDEVSQGLHCVQIWGFDDSKRVFILSNSWSSRWGDNGYFYLPYDYVLSKKISLDLWYINAI